MRRDPLLKKHDKGLEFDSARDMRAKKPRIEQKEISVREEDISSIQILGTKEEGTSCPQGYEQKGGKDGF